MITITITPKVYETPAPAEYWRLPHDAERTSEGGPYGGDGFRDGKARGNTYNEETGERFTIPEVFRFEPSQTTPLKCDYIRLWWAMNPQLDRERFESLLDNAWAFTNNTGWPGRYNCLTGEDAGKGAASLAGMSEKLREYKQSVEHYIESLKESNLQLRQVQEELIRSEKLSSVGRLAAGVAHEIGNPIGIILGYLEILRRSLDPGEECIDALTRIEREVMRIDHIVRELLSFARPGPLNLHPIAVNRVVEEAIALMSHQQGFRAVAVDAQLDRHLPAVMADEGQLKQVMINLFINAMDAMPRRGAG